MISPINGNQIVISKQHIKNNLLYIFGGAYIVRLFVWSILLVAETSPEVTWKDSWLGKIFKLLVPDLSLIVGAVEALYTTLLITVVSWMACILLSMALSYISILDRTIDRVVSSLLWFSNFHLFGGYLLLFFFLYPEDPSSPWVWASLIIIFCNGILKDTVKAFVDQLRKIFDKEYVKFSISQGINKWVSAKQELVSSCIQISLEKLPFFLLSSIIVELAFDNLVGLGSLLLRDVKAITDFEFAHDKVDPIFIVVIILIIIVRMAKIGALIIENNIKKIRSL